MGQKDIVAGRCLSDDDRYADLINGVIFAGKQMVKGSDLDERDTKLLLRLRDRGKYLCGLLRYRDMVRRVAFGVNFAVVGIENQSEVHYLMPLRTMLYDAGEYEKQASQIGRRIRKISNISSGEFLSGFLRSSRLRPCVTLVLYYGDEWDGGTQLHDLLDFTDIPVELKKYVNNYSVNVINISKLENLEVFRTDLKQIFSFVKYSRDKKKLREIIEKDKEHYQQMEPEAYDMIAEYSNTGELKLIKGKNTKGGKVDMCQAIKELIEDGRNEGIMQGRSEGIEAFIESIITILQQRGNISAAFLARINMQTDIEILQKWVLLAANAKSIEEFEERMDDAVPQVK